MALLLHPQTGPGQEPGSVGELLSLAQTDQGTFGPRTGKINNHSSPPLSLPACVGSRPPLCSAGFWCDPAGFVIFTIKRNYGQTELCCSAGKFSGRKEVGEGGGGGD